MWKSVILQVEVLVFYNLGLSPAPSTVAHEGTRGRPLKRNNLGVVRDPWGSRFNVSFTRAVNPTDPDELRAAKTTPSKTYIQALPGFF